MESQLLSNVACKGFEILLLGNSFYMYLLYAYKIYILYIWFIFLKGLQQITKSLLSKRHHCFFHSCPSSNLRCNQRQLSTRLKVYRLLSSTAGTKDWQWPSQEPAVSWVSKSHGGCGSQGQTTEGAGDQLCQELQVFPQGCVKESWAWQINVSSSARTTALLFSFLDFLPQRNVPGGKGSANVIGGSGLLVHSRGKNSDLDEWLKDAAEVRRPLDPSYPCQVCVQPLTPCLNPVLPSGGASAQARREYWRQSLQVSSCVLSL